MLIKRRVLNGRREERGMDRIARGRKHRMKEKKNRGGTDRRERGRKEGYHFKTRASPLKQI